MLWLFTIALVVLSAAGGIAWVSWRTRKKPHAALAVPLCPIRDAAPGSRIRVVGTALADGAHVESPYTRRPCLACSAEVAVASGSNHPIREQVQMAARFVVDDGTGRAVIDAGDDLRLDVYCETVRLDDGAHHAFGSDIVKRNAAALGGGASYSEGLVTDRMRVCVVGMVRQGDGGTPMLIGTPAEPLMISTDDRLTA